jgi:serine/threonine protein kinase
MPVFKELTDILNVENSVDFGWKSLMARFDFYKAKHISSFSRCKDPAEALLLDLKNRMITVDELYRQFEKMGHKEAMDVIKQQVSPSVLMSQTTQDMIKPQQENPCYLDNSLPLEPGGVIRISQEQPLLLPSAPPPPSTALLECEADLSMSKMNMEWARKETGDFKQCCIGGSCYGLSFRVTPPGGGSKVVIKKLSSEVDIAGLPRLCRLNHTNLAKVFGYLSPHDQSCHFCLIREFVCGHPLDHLLKHIDAMKVPESTYAWPSWQSRLLLAKGVASGLDYLHSNGCYHGHLTSCNVIVGDGGVKMTDYALTNSLGKTHMTEFSKRETEAFTAPEVMRTGAVSSYGDVYAYGNVGFSCVVGVVVGQVWGRHVIDMCAQYTAGILSTSQTM